MMSQADITARLQAALADRDPSGALDACAEVLQELRPMDQTGALALVTGDSILSKYLMVARAGGDPTRTSTLAQRLLELAGRRACLGCGTCCRRSSPTLYAADHQRICPEGLHKKQLYTLRPGERVSSIRQGRSMLLEQEMIKVAERPGSGCVYLRENKCSVYSNRPHQCRCLQCWSGRHAGQDQDQRRLNRATIYAGDQTALALIREYDIKLPAREITRDLEAAVEGEVPARERLLAYLELDHRLRLGISARYGYDQEELPLLLGRPVREVMGLYGLGVELGDGERPVVVSLGPGS